MKSVRLRLLVVLLIALFVVAAIAALNVISSGPVDGPRTERAQNLVRIGHALAVYRSRTGHFPHSEKGPGAALYQLEGLLDATAFDIPGVKGDGQRSRYDENTKRVAGLEYHYLNEPLSDNGGDPGTPVCLMAEKARLVGGQGVNVLTSEGAVLYLPLKGKKSSVELLGKRWDELDWH